MLQEAVDELFCREGASAFLASVTGLIAEGDLVVFKGLNAFVTNGHAEDVRGQVFQGVVSGTYRLAVHDPLLPPDLWKNGPIWGFLLQSLAHLGAENLGKRSDWDQEFPASWMPGGSICSQRPRRDEVMDMGVKGQVASPGMQDPHQANLPAQEARVKG